VIQISAFATSSDFKSSENLAKKLPDQLLHPIVFPLETSTGEIPCLRCLIHWITLRLSINVPKMIPPISQTHPETVRETGSIDPTHDLSCWAPSSSMFQSQDADHRGIWSTSCSGRQDVTLPTIIDDGMEHVTEVNAYGTLPKRGQELFIHSRKNHIADLIKANNDLELEIVALERSWHDIDRRNIHDSVGMAACAYGRLIPWLACGVSTVLMARLGNWVNRTYPGGSWAVTHPKKALRVGYPEGAQTYLVCITQKNPGNRPYPASVGVPRSNPEELHPDKTGFTPPDCQVCQWRWLLKRLLFPISSREASLNKGLKRPDVLSKKDVRSLQRRRKHWNSWKRLGTLKQSFLPYSKKSTMKLHGFHSKSHQKHTGSSEYLLGFVLSITLLG